MDDNEIRLRMNKVIEVLQSKYTAIRAGRANLNILHGIMVDYYGTPTPIQSLANIVIPEARVISIKPFDKSSLKNIEKSIYEANLGMAPTNNGETVMITIPELTGETRKQYVKDAASIAEEAKISIRNIRQEENNKVKRAEIREDEETINLAKIQTLTDEYNKKIEDIYKDKEKELTTL